MSDRVDRFRRNFLLLLTLGVSAAFLYMIRDFLLPLLLAAVFTGMSMPLFGWIARKVGGRKVLAAALTLLLLLLAVGLPLAGLIGIVASSAIEIATQAVPWIKTTMSRPSALVELIYERIPALRQLDPYRESILTRIGTLTERAGNVLVHNLSAITGGTFGFLLGLFVFLYAMFFFLISGGETLRKLLSYMPLPEGDKDRLIGRFVSVARATLRGTLVVGLVQALLTGLALWIAGIGAAAFWAVLIFVLSVLPGVGAPIVWVPAVIYLLATGHTGAAIGLAVWCGAVVGTIDNLLRPRLVGSDTQLPDLLILISTLGGITLFGAAGLIVGPILAALFITVWEIYGEAFRDVLKEPAAEKPAG